MNKFHFICPSEVYFGRGCISENSHVFATMGKRAYVVTSEFPDNVENLALTDVKNALEKEGITYVVDEGAQPDPPVESVVAIRDRALLFMPDFLVAVGGGSAMDTVKALNILLKHPKDDAYDVLFGKGPHVFGVGGPDQGAYPFVSVPTTAGTGSEIAGVGVMTRNDIHTKFATNRRSYADYVFEDSRYIESCSKSLNHATALDALCHGIEIFMSRNSQNDFMTNMIAEKAFTLFADIKEAILNDSLTTEEYDKQALHSMLQGIIIVNELTGVPHGMGYPLSYIYHVPHGLACGVFEGEYLRIHPDQDRVKMMLEKLGFNNIDDFCEYIQAIVTQHVDISVTEDQIDQWTKEFCDTKWRVDRHPGELSYETVKIIYERALAKFIVK